MESWRFSYFVKKLSNLIHGEYHVINFFTFSLVRTQVELIGVIEFSMEIVTRIISIQRDIFEGEKGALQYVILLVKVVRVGECYSSLDSVTQT